MYNNAATNNTDTWRRQRAV